jgi:hypothetical protein
MLKTTLSTITAIVISISNLNADRGISYNGTGTKDMHVVSKVEVYQEDSYIEPTTGGVYDQSNAQDDVIYSEPNPPMEYTPAPYPQNDIVEPTPSYNNTIIYAKPAKKYYRVGEAIKLRLKLKNKSHLYIWTVGRNGQGYMLLPNRFNGYNRFKRNYAYVFPERSLNFEFQSDQAGTEHVYILATNKPISTAKMESIFNKKVGNYPTASARATKDFTTKDIHVIAKREHLKYDIAHVAIQVVEKQGRGNRPAQTAEYRRDSDITINIRN